MKVYRFRLEGLLRQRKVVEERCLSELRVFQSALADAASRKNQLDAERERTIDSLRTLEVGEIAMEELLRHRRYLVALDNRAREVDAEMVRRRYEMRDAQAAADQAIRERQLVERLKEKRKEEYDLDLRRKETRELDEIAGGIHARGRSAELSVDRGGLER